MAYRATLIAGLSFFLASGVMTTIAACSSDKDSGSADSANQCASSPTYLECSFCCGLPAYTDMLDNAAVDCICDQACKTECAAACVLDGDAAAPSAACNTCKDSDQTANTCRPVIQAVCDKDPECTKAQACSRAAGCQDKPDLADGG